MRRCGSTRQRLSSCVPPVNQTLLLDIPSNAATSPSSRPFVLHRHRRIWSEPNAFNPDRFMPTVPPPAKFAYLPFGVGPRVCVGAHFALTEATLVLARLIERFRIDLTDPTRPVHPVAVITTQPDHPPLFTLKQS